MNIIIKEKSLVFVEIDVCYGFSILFKERKIFVISSNDPQLFLIKS